MATKTDLIGVCSLHGEFYMDDPESECPSCQDDNNIMTCERCGNLTSFERHDESLPREGEHCDGCNRWVCAECVNWGATNDSITLCKDCAKEE